MQGVPARTISSWVPPRRPKLFESANLIDATDDLPHDGGLAAAQHTERDHVGHRSRLYDDCN